ncbi:MAG: hypothetical protein M0R17_07590 [Candidatus Omnitrophica bacterium]|jgi:hypothetical protein|nr:hypothetical protein [Candidatus Omnitrophota bacterium]
MTQEEIVNGNKLIAEFMGYKFSHYTIDPDKLIIEISPVDESSTSYYPDDFDTCWCCSKTPDDSLSWKLPNQLNFNLSWNKLMEVWVEFLNRTTKYGLTFCATICYLPQYRMAYEIGFGLGDIDIAYSNILYLIDWYNKNKPTNE